MLKRIIRLLYKTSNHGIYYLISYVYPVYWSQDLYSQNKGYDLVTFRKTGYEYFRGTLNQRKRRIMGVTNEKNN